MNDDKYLKQLLYNYFLYLKSLQSVYGSLCY